MGFRFDSKCSNIIPKLLSGGEMGIPIQGEKKKLNIWDYVSVHRQFDWRETWALSLTWLVMCLCVKLMVAAQKRSSCHWLLPTPNWHQTGKSMPGRGVCGVRRGRWGPIWGSGTQAWGRCVLPGEPVCTKQVVLSWEGGSVLQVPVSSTAVQNQHSMQRSGILY